MKLVKCPRCELNYITENEKYCKVCLREMKGEAPKDEVELCSVCNEAPALPGMPYALRAGDTARQIVFSVRVGSATTRLVVRASFPLSLHSTDA